jgi:serralysin
MRGWDSHACARHRIVPEGRCFEIDIRQPGEWEQKMSDKNSKSNNDKESKVQFEKAVVDAKGAKDDAVKAHRDLEDSKSKLGNGNKNEQAKADKAHKNAKEKADKADMDAKDKSEKAEKSEKAHKDLEAKAEAAEKAAKAAAEKAAAEKAAAEKAAAEKAAAEKAAAEKAAAEKAAAEKAAAEKAAADKAAAEKAAADKAAADKAAAEKAAADKAAADEAAKHSDLHIGDGAKNALTGDEHVSVIFGEGGKDTLVGGAGDDRMHGGGGDDTMSGDEGNDTMFGSATVGGKVDMSNFKVTEDTTAHITFNYESAGYKNALGMYKIAADGTISGVQILFANASLKGSGGDLISGISSIDVGVKGGEKLGFFVVPDGFSQRGMAALLSDKSAGFKFVGADGKPGNVNGGGELKLIQVNAAGVETVVKSTYGTSIFHSADNGALGLNGDGMKHVTGTVNNVDGTVKIGFEDLKWGGDKDFDDSVFTVSLGTTNTALLAKEATKSSRSSDNDDMKGGTGNDKMFGMADNDKMDGGAGDDQMWGNSGNDVMNGGDGNDTLSGGKGDDVVYDGLGNDSVAGNSGNDKFVAGEGNDSYDGGAGFDTLDFSGASRGLRVDLNSHVASGMGSDAMKGIEGVIGSRFNDTLVGDKNANVFAGGAGDDDFRGRGGADAFTGGAGRDTYSWTKKDVNAVDHITDFAKGDRLNLHDLIKGQTFADAVRVTDTAAGSKVSVKFDGSFHDVVVLDGVHGQSAAELLKAGMILV